MRVARIVPCLLLILAVLSVMHFLGVPGAEMRPNRATLRQILFAALTFHMNVLSVADKSLSLDAEDLHRLAWSAARIVGPITGRQRSFTPSSYAEQPSR
jgi:hypothetical protein